MNPPAEVKSRNRKAHAETLEKSGTLTPPERSEEARSLDMSAQSEKARLPKDWRRFPRGGVVPAGTGVQYHTGDWRTDRPVWIPENCIHCLICWVYCPDMAVIVENGKMVGFDFEHCKGCGICAWECPTKDKAIEMRPETDEDRV